MFLPLIKKALIGIKRYNKLFCQPSCVLCPRGQNNGAKAHIFLALFGCDSTPDENISATPKNISATTNRFVTTLSQNIY